MKKNKQLNKLTLSILMLTSGSLVFAGGAIPINIPSSPSLERPIQQVPDDINFNKLNLPRACTPVEKLQGITDCAVCSPDKTNIVLDDTPANRRLATQHGGILINSMLKAEYHGTYKEYAGSSSNTRPKLPAFGGGRNDTVSYAILFTGYRLKGQHPKFQPINNRTVCETLRPKNPANYNPEKDGFKGMAGAGVMAIGGVALSGGMNSVITNKDGGGANIGGGSGGGGMSMSMPATEAFACLEYFTRSNAPVPGSPVDMGSGGYHLKGNLGASHKCMQPMQQYYNTKMDEIYCYGSPCDGQADGAFKPTTIAMRYMFLMTNPYIMIGQTLPQSLQIAQQRPMMMMPF